MPLPTLYRAVEPIPELGVLAGDYVAVHARYLTLMRELPRELLTPKVMARLAVPIPCPARESA